MIGEGSALDQRLGESDEKRWDQSSPAVVYPA